MRGKVNLREFAEQLDIMSDMTDEWCCFVNRSTGELVTLETQYWAMAEDEVLPTPLFGAEACEQLELAETILAHWGEMLHFPNKREWDEYGMMEDFSEAYPDEHIRECLCIAISGRGAFRRFKDTLARFGAAERWYAFRDVRMLKFARNWCEENQVPWNEEEVR